MKKEGIPQGIFVTGTDTNVGKTWVGSRVIKQISELGINVIPRKPVESGWLDEAGRTDAWQLAKAAGKADHLAQVCPNPLKAAVSPVRAARDEGKTITIQMLQQQCLTGLKLSDFLYVEGAGGFFSPLANDGLNADLAKRLQLPVLLVAEDRLGCINHTLLTLAAIKHYGLVVEAVILNSREDTGDMFENDNSMDNEEDLKSLIDVPLFKTQYGQARVDEEIVSVLVKKLSQEV